MVWDGIMGRRKTNPIVVQGSLNAQGYINQILQPEAVPFLQRYGPAILMHDNARPHVARICRQFINRGNVHNLRDLENALIQEWNHIPNVVIRRYVRPMRGRPAVCINSRGGHARY